MPPTSDSAAKKSLTMLAVGGAAAGVGGKIANVIVGIGSIAILARLLSPEKCFYVHSSSRCLRIRYSHSWPVSDFALF